MIIHRVKLAIINGLLLDKKMILWPL